jgi:putative ABC transport system permease protein
MVNIFKIAARNLMRYKRRTLLVGALIALGVIAVQIFVATSGSYKSLIVGQITDAILGQIQIHKKGYVVSIENVPLNLNLLPNGVKKIEKVLSEIPEIESYSNRIRLGGMISNFTENTNIRIYGVDPATEFKTVPLLPKRITEGKAELNTGEILLPQLIAKGLNLSVGAPVVIIATNKDGSVNGQQFIVSGIVESAPGPGGRDAYINILDAMSLLRMEEREISEIAIHVKDFSKLNMVNDKLEEKLSKLKNPKGMPIFEIHTWEKLSPFANIAKMIDLLSVFIRIMLIAIVLISIMDVMIMSVYERTREIGTLSAIGTPPNRILGMFLTEGALLGLFGVVVGNFLSFIAVLAIRLSNYSFSFGMKDGFILSPHMTIKDVIIVSAVVIIVSILGSLQPAFKASRLDPIKALKSV